MRGGEYFIQIECLENSYNRKEIVSNDRRELTLYVCLPVSLSDSLSYSFSCTPENK